MSDAIGNFIVAAGALVFLAFVLAMAIPFYSMGDVTQQHTEDYGISATVTTTAEYEYLTNDSFTGVVVSNWTAQDMSCVVVSKNGEERTIATKYLEPMD